MKKKSSSMKRMLARVEAIKDLVQEAVDKGATSVEQIHKIVATLPLSALEERGLLGEVPGKTREIVDQTIGSVYEAIRQINREVGELASGLLESIEDHDAAARNIDRIKK